MKIKPLAAACLLCISPMAITPLAQAALHDRGNGLVYDDVLNVTWAQDVGLAYSLGYNPVDGTFGNGPEIEDDLATDSFFTHDEAKAFAAALNTTVFDGTLGYAGITTWQLPDLGVVDLSDTTSADDGSENKGYNITRTDSPLAHMHYVTLGAIGSKDAAGAATGCITSGNYINCLLNTAGSQAGIFKNIEAINGTGDTTSTVFYQQDLLDALGNPVPNRAWAFVTRLGFQGERVANSGSNGGGGHAWVLAPGDVAPPPPPPPAPTLHERAGGLVYDSTLNLTWAGDVGLAKTLGYDPISRTFGNSPATTDGFLTHDQAKDFVEDLNTQVIDGLVGYQGITTWSLPSLSVADLSDTSSRASGSKNKGYNIKRTDSPLAHMFYVSLGAKGRAVYNGADTACETSPTSSCLLNTGDPALLSLFDFSVLNTTSDTVSTLFYKEDVLDALGDPVPNRAWGFVSRKGFQGDRVDDSATYGGGGWAWVVAEGDVAPLPGEEVSVPFPGWALFAMSILLVTGHSLSSLRKRCS